MSHSQSGTLSTDGVISGAISSSSWLPDWICELLKSRFDRLGRADNHGVKER